MELWIGALNLGFLYAFMTMGIFFTFRIHDFPDITVDGSFTSGAAVAAIMLIGGWNPGLALAAAFVVGGIAGGITAFVNTRFNVNGLLAGILVMTGLYSLNLHIMGRSNIPLLNQTTIFTYVEKLNPGMHPEIWTCILLAAIMAVFWLIITLFLKTDLGIAMRATGNNPVMASANGVNVGWMTIFGVAMANGMVGVSGGLVAQYQGFADIGMGIGTVVIGLAAVIIGESVFRFNSIAAKVCSVVIGAVIFRLIIAFALYVGMNPIDLKLLTAVFVFLTLVVSKYMAGRTLIDFAKITAAVKKVPPQTAGGILVSLVIVCGAAYGIRLGMSSPPENELAAVVPEAGGAGQEKPRIGIVQFALEPNVELCKEGILKALAENGFVDGKNIEIVYGNAQADFSTINSIIQDFLRRKVSIITPLSTPCVQSAVQLAAASTGTKVVFTYIFDPYRIGAAKSSADHLPNMTGIACFPPTAQMLDLIKELLPGKKKVGIVWNSSEANSESVLLKLREHALITGQDIIEATVTGPAEVLEASRSLVHKGAQVFLNGGDNTLNVGYDSFQKVADEARIPIFSVDSEFIEKGALAVLGPDYYQTGYEGGQYLARVLRGEDTAKLPILQTQKTKFIFSPEAAGALKLTVNPEPLKKAVIRQQGATAAAQVVPQKRLALFRFSDNALLLEITSGFTDFLEESGALKKYNLVIDAKSAQNEFSMAQSILQDIVRQQYAYLVTISTPALQVAAQVNKTIPHVFGGVTDPYRMGVAKSPKEHLPQLTGVATFQPVRSLFKIMRAVFPQAKRVGIVWNPGEACSEACTFKARDAAREFGFELVETTVSGTSEVLDAVRTVIGKKIDLFVTSGDNTVILACDMIVAALHQERIPYCTNAPADIERGAFLSVGADYREVGRETAKMALRVMGGEKPQDMAINDCVPEKTALNRALAEQYGISIPESVLKRASFVKDK